MTVRLFELELENFKAALDWNNSELERFAYVVSHDLQAPLQTISNYVQLLERRYREKLDTKADKYEYDSKVIREIKSNRLRFKEVPVHTRYTSYSMGKKQKQGFINGLVTLGRMLWKMIA